MSDLTTKRLAAAAVALSTAAVLAACSNADGEPQAAGTGGGSCDGQTVRVGITNSASDAPLYIAQDAGYFAEEGLSVELLPFDSAARMIAPMGAGDLDVGAGAPSAGFYNAVGRDVNLRIVADKGSMPENYGYMPLLVRADLYESGEVTSIEDLKGRIVAEPAEGTATASTLATILDSAGLSYDDVEHQFLGFGEHPAAYAGGSIEASLTTDPAATTAVENGAAVLLATPPDYYDNQQLAVLLYEESFATENAEAAQCFMNAYLRGARDYVSAYEDGELAGENSDEVVRIVTEATGLDEELFRKITPNYVDPNGAVNVESLQKDYDFFDEQGLLESTVTVEDIVDSSFAEAAVAKLGEHAG